ncbi:MAG: hypothetical protein IMZ52_04665 [Actinobacteria bacterium]|nr:hypothetical protein [Actinomycetota bacterium]MBE3114757.1 hypothetical protein [Actinomycetota bacterium]
MVFTLTPTTLKPGEKITIKGTGYGIFFTEKSGLVVSLDGVATFGVDITETGEINGFYILPTTLVKGNHKITIEGDDMSFIVDDTPVGCVNYSEIFNIITTLTKDTNFWFHTGNIYYKLVDEIILRKALDEEKTNSWKDTSKLPFIPKDFDCTEFSKAMLGYLVKYFYPNSPCIGIIYIKKLEGNHNMLFFINQKKELWLLEPQSDTWMPWSSGNDIVGIFI